MRALPIFEREVPGDSRPRDAIDSAFTFAAGGRRTNALRTSAWVAYRAALEASSPAAVDAAHAACQAAAAAFLHPLARAHQVKHVLGSAAHAARAAEIDAGPISASRLDALTGHANTRPLLLSPSSADYPSRQTVATALGELMRMLDDTLRQ